MRLSNRDVLVKEASALDDFIKGTSSSMEGRLRLRTHPFETLLSLAMPFVLGRTFLGVAFLGLTEHFRIGLGTWLGKWLDKTLGFGDAANVPSLSEGSLHSAAEGAAEKLLGALSAKTASNRDNIEKYAFGFKSFKSTAAKAGATSIMYKLIMFIIMALASAGIIGGLARMILGPTEEEEKTEREKQVSENLQEPTQKYANVKSDVEQTLIVYLDVALPKIPNPDGQVKNFSETFEFLKKHSLIGSPEMANVLKQISKSHSFPIERINSSNAFYGPTILNLAQKLMPELQLKPGKQKEELKPGKQKEELKQLLQGVFA